MTDRIPVETGEELSLDKAILSIRSKRPKVCASLPFTVYENYRFVQLWVNTPACRFSMTGKCSICDYWDGEASEDAVQQACEYIDNIGDAYDTMLLDTCGSCLCDYELPFERLASIVNAIARTSVKRVIFESHLAYATLDKLKFIVTALSGKEIVLEYGQESTSPYVLQYCLNKPSMLLEYNIIPSLQQLGVSIMANIVVGAPFLSVHERIKDAVDSIRTLLQKGIDGVVLFPVNIKPFTLIKHLYDNGYYKRVNAIEIIKVLNSFSAEDLNRIEISWFEPQREKLPAYNEVGLGPLYCEKCGETLLRHLLNYRDTADGSKRKQIIIQAEKTLCDCAYTVYDYPFPDIHETYRFIAETVH